MSIVITHLGPYRLSWWDDDNSLVIPGHWVAASCEKYEAAIEAAGGRAELCVWSSFTSVDVDVYTQWGRGNRQPVAADRLVGAGPTAVCSHAIFVPEEET